jgi:hypothetical protein
VWLLGLSLLLAVSAATALCQADEPKKDLTAEEKDRALEEISLAYRIADAGRKAGSPEALLGAARLLSKLGGKEIGLVKLEGVKPPSGKMDDKKKPTPGEPVKEDGGKPSTFTAEIQKLKEDAHKLNKPRDETLVALIDGVDEKGRGSLGGPKWIGPFTLGPIGYDNSKYFTFTFRANEPARVLVRNRSGFKLRLRVWESGEDDDGTRWQTSDPLDGASNLEWRGRPDHTAKFAVEVSNWHTGNIEFDIFKN